MTDSNKPGRLGIGIIGAGRVGAVLGSALRASGHAIIGVSAVSEESRERADVMLPGVPILSVEQVVERAELVVIAIPDDALAPLIAGCAKVGVWQPGQLVMHVSGRYGTDVLEPARLQGAIPLAVHPAMTFTGTSIDLSRLIGTPFAVTAPNAVLPIAQALVVEMGGEPMVLGEGDRGVYHAALSHGSNHLVTLISQCTQLLKSAGIDKPGTLLASLLAASLDGALWAADSGDPISTLTGPVSRGDAGTVADHIAVVAQVATEQGSPDLLDSYRVLARSTTIRALTSGRIGDAATAELLTVLSEERL